MSEADDKSFFDRLGEILNAPLPGTKRPEASSRTEQRGDGDDSSVLDRIRDILRACEKIALSANSR